jgi:hypothetical protein
MSLAFQIALPSAYSSRFQMGARAFTASIASMNGRRTDHDRDVAGSDASNAMRDRYTNVSEPRRCFGRNGVELDECQRPVRFVLECGDGVPSLVRVAHHTEKRHDAAETRRAHATFDGAWIERRFIDRHHPPPTAGRIASSSPSCKTRSGSLILPPTANRTPCSSDNCGIVSSKRIQASQTRAPSAISMECRSASNSRARANVINRTVTR